MVDHVFPEDAGTGGFASGSGDPNDAANFASWGDAIGGGTNQVNQGMTFTGSDANGNGNWDTLDISAGKAVVTEASATAGTNSETRDEGVAYVAEKDAVTGLALTFDATNHVFLDVDLTSDDTATYVINTTGSAPTQPSLKIGEIDTTNNVAVEFNRGGDEGVVGAVKQGMALADNGGHYSSVQTAVENSTNWTLVGPGHFLESATSNVGVEITDSNFTLMGVGRSSLIEGDSGRTGIIFNNTNITVQNLRARSSDICMNTYVNADKKTNIINCWVEGASDGIWPAPNSIVSNLISTCDRKAIQCPNKTTISNCHIVTNDTSNESIGLRGDDAVVTNCYVEGASGSNEEGMRVQGNDSNVSNNRILNVDVGFNVDGTNDIISNNRISASSTAIDTAGATTPTVEGNNTN